MYLFFYCYGMATPLTGNNMEFLFVEFNVTFTRERFANIVQTANVTVNVIVTIFINLHTSNSCIYIYICDFIFMVWSGIPCCKQKVCSLSRYTCPKIKRMNTCSNFSD